MYRVILVDDERLIIRGLSSVVPWAELGCEVAGVAYDGKSGLELIRSLKPDIVMTDIRMPNMDGLTMLAAIRSEYPQIQTAVLTAYRDFDYARQALTLGVCRYLLKPSNLDELKETVRLMASRLDTMPARKDEPEEETVQAAGNHLVRAALAYIREHCSEQHLSLGEVADQSAENFALTQAPANVADIKEQLHGELRIFDIGAVEETEQLLFRLAAHTACDSKQIQACV